MGNAPFLDQQAIFVLKARQDFSLVHEVMGNNKALRS